MTDINKTGYKLYDMIPKQRISPKIKELQKTFETIPQNKDFKNQGIKDDLEMLGSIKKEQNKGNSQKEALGQIDQRYNEKGYAVEEPHRIRDDILKQSKRKPPIDPKIQDLQKKLQGSDAHSSLKEQQKSGSVKNFAAKFKSLSNAKESKIDTKFHKVKKSGDDQSCKSFMKRLDKELEQTNNTERSR